MNDFAAELDAVVPVERRGGACSYDMARFFDRSGHEVAGISDKAWLFPTLQKGEQVFLVGRGPANSDKVDINLGNDEDGERTVSRYHATIRVRVDNQGEVVGAMIRDDGSTNGTAIDDLRKIPSGEWRSVQLGIVGSGGRHIKGSTIRFGPKRVFTLVRNPGKYSMIK